MTYKLPILKHTTVKYGKRTGGMVRIYVYPFVDLKNMCVYIKREKLNNNFYPTWLITNLIEHLKFIFHQLPNFISYNLNLGLYSFLQYSQVYSL